MDGCLKLTVDNAPIYRENRENQPAENTGWFLHKFFIFAQ